MEIIVKCDDYSYAVLESWLGTGKVEEWLQQCLDNKIRTRIDASILEHTNLNPKKMKIEEKINELKKVSLPTREERDSLPLKISCYSYV